jgi:hypothetical protein
MAYRETVVGRQHLFHRFDDLMIPTKVDRIERIEVDADVNDFPHITMGIEQEPGWSLHDAPYHQSELYVDSGSDLWVWADGGMVPAQLSVKLVRDFISERMCNTAPGQDGQTSVREAWQLIAT